MTRAIAPLRRRKAESRDAAEVAPAAPKASAKPSTPLLRSPRPRRRNAAPPPLAPLGRRMKQKLARGTTEIDGRIDLHGMTQADAHAALAHFLRRAQRATRRSCWSSPARAARQVEERGVLKRQVPLWLESAELRSFVVGFESAGIGHGGEGALYVRVSEGGERTNSSTVVIFVITLL